MREAIASLLGVRNIVFAFACIALWEWVPHPPLEYVYNVVILLVAVRILTWLFGGPKWDKKGKPRSYVLSSSEFGRGKSIPCINPATGEKVAEVKAYTKEEVDEIVSRARKAQQVWAQTSFAERSAVLSDLLEAILKNQEEICRYSIQDSGKTALEAKYGEILTTCEKLRYLINSGADALKTEHRSPPLLLFLKEARVEYHPLGVIAIIIPWNYPFHNVASAVAATLFAGNAAVVKVSEFSLSSKDYFEGLFRQVLANRGYDPQLVTLMAGEGETGAALVDSDIDKVFFIGSPATGKRIMAAAAKKLTPVLLELGGKDPFIVLDDADLDLAIEVALRGVFVNCGQNCIAAERIYVHDAIYDRFLEAVTKKVKALRQGAASKGGCYDIGCMTMPRQVEIVDELVQDAVKQGAKINAGGKRNDKLPNGLFYEPTVLSNVTHEMRVVNEEAFGPVMLVIRFKSDDQVIQMANGTDYALGCSIFSNNYSRAERIARNVVSGMVTINDLYAFPSPVNGISYLVQSLPFGGVKVSGFGRFNGPEGLREFSRQKSVVTDRFPIRTKPPRFTSFPIPDHAPALVTAAINMIYAGSLSTKVSNLLSLIRLSVMGG